jgi:hypothetical protein
MDIAKSIDSYLIYKTDIFVNEEADKVKETAV